MTHPTPADQRTALIERVEAGETGRQLDAEVAKAAGWGDQDADGSWHAIGRFFDDGKLRRTAYEVELPDFTTSIDAQAALPGRIKWVERTASTSVTFFARTESRHYGIAPTECGARLAALLRGMG